MSKETFYTIFVPGSEPAAQSKAEETVNYLSSDYNSEIIRARVIVENVIENTAEGGPNAVIVKSTKK